MKIRVSRLRHLIREVLLQEDGVGTAATEYPPESTRRTEPAPTMATIPAGKSKGEQEFSKDMGGRKWGNDRNQRVGQKTPVQNKTMQVMDILKKNNAWSSMSEDQRIKLHSSVETFIQNMDPGDAMIATAQQIAQHFNQKN